MAAKGTIIKKMVQSAEKVNLGSALKTAAVPAYFGVQEYNRSREAGKGVLGSAASAGVDFALSEALGMKYMLFGLAQAAPSMAVGAYNTIDQMSRQMNSKSMNTPFIRSQFQDTQQAYTMRQYGMQLAKNSRYNLEQSLMGNEAQHFKY